MREIKFKAFIKELGTTHKVLELHCDGGVMVEGYDFPLNAEDINLMQYTDLKDKNGVEIYEGDIISVDIAYNCDFEYKRPDTVINHKVKTVNMEASFSGGCFHLKSDKIPEDEDMLWIWCNDAEVIGNIYENPELIPK